VLLLSGVTPIEATPPDVCSKAPFQGTPPSEHEWSLLAHDSSRFRAQLWRSDDWLYFAHPEWTADGLHARSGEGWETGRLAYRDSLAVRWADVERLDCNRGSRSAQGALLGAAAGAGTFAGLLACDDCDVGWWSILAIPAGMVIGSVIGASLPVWRTAYCAGAPDTSASPDRP
jgi:hypothetical protein